jgi:uncharacterized cupin superfamily protein
MPEADYRDTEHGRLVDSDGWFVLNLAGAGAQRFPGMGWFVPFESREHRYPQFGINVHFLAPGEPNAMYHRESAQEAFFVLHGECIAIVEDVERRLRQWDLFHCPPETPHVLVGAGDGPCAILMVGTRDPGHTVHYPVSEVAARHGASTPTATDSSAEAYAHLEGDFEPARSSWPLDGATG